MTLPTGLLLTPHFLKNFAEHPMQIKNGIILQKVKFTDLGAWILSTFSSTLSVVFLMIQMGLKTQNDGHEKK